MTSKHFPVDFNTPVSADHLWAYIQHELLGADLQDYAHPLRFDLEHGHALLILDGLDEVPYPEGMLKARQKQLIGLAQSIHTCFSKSRVLVASRPHAYADWTLPGFNAVTITAFEDQHRIDLATRLYRAAGLTETTARENARNLNRQLQPIDPELKDRPLFVTLMATIYLKSGAEGLPTRRGALYRKSILLLLDRWTQSKTGAPSLVEILGNQSPTDLYMCLAALAYDVHHSSGEQKGIPEIDVGKIYEHLVPLNRVRAAQLIPYLSENAGVLVSPGQDTQKNIFHFAHRSFQEYLAAAYLVHVCKEANSFAQIGQLIASKPDVWRKPAAFAGDVLADMDTDRRGNLWDLLDDLLDDEVPDDVTKSDPRWWRVWLASVILQEQNMLADDKLRSGEKTVCNKLREWTLKALEIGALLPVERASCGRALGLLGDPRKGVGLTAEGLPDIDWVDIPAGEFIYGTEDENNGPTPLSLPVFKIARYPVTYAQFQAFVESEDGYQHDEWWAALAATEKDRTIQTPSFPYANHPCESINWYEAVAFCQWLSSKLGYTVTLPTEQQWEKAARGSDGRIYSYGSTFDANRGNSHETGIGMTSAVGLFPDGDRLSPYQIADMSGNVWEWCLNKYQSIKDTTLNETDICYERGGSWNSTQDQVRSTSHLNDNTNYRLDDLGFRVVRPPSL